MGPAAVFIVLRSFLNFHFFFRRTDKEQSVEEGMEEVEKILASEV